MRRLIAATTCIVAGIALSGPLFAKTIVVGGEVYSPLTNKDKTGVQFDWAKIVFNNLKIGEGASEEVFDKVEIVTGPYDRILDGVKKGKIDAMVGTVSWNKGVIFSESITEAVKINVVYHKKGKRKYKDLLSLKGTMTAAIRGYKIEEMLSADPRLQPITVSAVDDRHQLFKMMKAGRIHFSIDGGQIWSTPEFSKYLPEINVEDAGFFEPRAAFADSPRGRLLKAAFDKKFQELRKARTFAPIYEQYKVKGMYQDTLDHEDRTLEQKRRMVIVPPLRP